MASGPSGVTGRRIPGRSASPAAVADAARRNPTKMWKENRIFRAPAARRRPCARRSEKFGELREESCTMYGKRDVRVLALIHGV